jgi:putative transposase
MAATFGGQYKWPIVDVYTGGARLSPAIIEPLSNCKRGLGRSRSSISHAEIAIVLKQAEDATAVGEVCRKAGTSEATF